MSGDMRQSGSTLVAPSVGTVGYSQGQKRRTYHIAISRNAQVLKPREPRRNGPEIDQQPWKNLHRANATSELVEWFHEEFWRLPSLSPYNLINISAKADSFLKLLPLLQRLTTSSLHVYSSLQLRLFVVLKEWQYAYISFNQEILNCQGFYFVCDGTQRKVRSPDCSNAATTTCSHQQTHTTHPEYPTPLRTSITR